ncbi:MAG: ABC transporter permease [candidate division KSB1 bacterium]|nr:ABC transporter permease [candidate division KSB1 bacterium]
MKQRVIALMRKEFIHIIRDLRSLAIIFLLPILMVIIYGYAVTFDVKEIRLAVLDESRSLESRRLSESLTASRYFLLVARLQSREEIEPLFLERRARAVLIIPRSFAQDLVAGSAQVQAVIDAADASTAVVAVNYLRSGLLQHSLTLNEAAFRPPMRIEPRVWYNPDLKSTFFIVPGLIAVIMMMICALLTSVTIARERETGTMEQIFVSPVHPWEIIIGKMSPYVILALLDGLGILLFARLVFKVPFRGSSLLFLALSIIFVVASLSIGLMISTRAKTQQAAMMIALLSTLMPSLLLSGFLYPIASLPKLLRVISVVVPAKYFLIIDRGIILKGAGMSQLLEPTLFLTLFSLVLMGISIKTFKMHF